MAEQAQQITPEQAQALVLQTPGIEERESDFGYLDRELETLGNKQQALEGLKGLSLQIGILYNIINNERDIGKIADAYFNTKEKLKPALEKIIEQVREYGKGWLGTVKAPYARIINFYKKQTDQGIKKLGYLGKALEHLIEPYQDALSDKITKLYQFKANLPR